MTAKKFGKAGKNFGRGRVTGWLYTALYYCINVYHILYIYLVT